VSRTGSGAFSRWEDAHGRLDDPKIGVADCKQPEPELADPIGAIPAKLKALSETGDRGHLEGAPTHTSPKWVEALFQIHLIGLPFSDNADRGECTEWVFALKPMSRGVINDPVTRVHPPQRRRLSMADLHKALSHAALNVLTRRDRDPVAPHDALGAKTRSR